MTKGFTYRARGYALVEAIVTLVIIGLLASVAMPNIAPMMFEAKGRLARRNLQVLQAACDSFFAVSGRYPTTGWKYGANGGERSGGFGSDDRRLGYPLDLDAVDPYGNKFLGGYLRVAPPTLAAALGLDIERGEAVYYGVDGTGGVFLTQVPPGDEGTWDLRQTPVLGLVPAAPPSGRNGDGELPGEDSAPPGAPPGPLLNGSIRVTVDPREDRVHGLQCDSTGRIWISWSNAGNDDNGNPRSLARVAAYRRDGTESVAAVQIGSPNWLENPAPKIAVDAEDRVWTLWLSGGYGHGQPYSMVLDPQGNAVGQASFQGVAGARHVHPYMAASSSGRVWVSYARDKAAGETGNFDVWVSSYEGPDRRVFGPVNITTEVPNAQTPALAPDPRGQGAWVCWTAKDSGSWNPYTCYVDGRGRVAAGPRCEVHRGSDLLSDENPQVAVAPDGKVWIAWQRCNGPGWDLRNWGIWLKVLNPDGSVFLDKRQEAAQGVEPALAIDPAGKVYLGWADVSSGQGEIRVQVLSSSGERLGVRCETDHESADRRPRLAVDRWGQVWLAWDTDRHANWEVYLKPVPPLDGEGQ